jgi:Arc/MetJ-type ribon-helix-helix transcriptional regulator
MTLTLRPEIARLVDDQVQAGRFPTPEAVVEAAIVNMRDSDDMDLDDETIDAINEGEEQGDRGEGVELAVFKEQLKRRLGGK